MAVGSEQPTPSPAISSTPVLQPIVKGSATPQAATGAAVKLVIARNVVGEVPVEKASRFVSPAYRLWAVATLTNVRSTDVLRFVFQRDGQTLPRDDITVVAGRTMGKHAFLAVQSFKVWADYDHGAKPLPSGSYRLLFYKNGLLLGQTAFRVG